MKIGKLSVGTVYLLREEYEEEKIRKLEKIFPHRWEGAIDIAIMTVTASPYSPLGLRLC
jgi:hypothetical protein